ESLCLPISPPGRASEFESGPSAKAVSPAPFRSVDVVETEPNQDNAESDVALSAAGAIPMSSELIDLTLPAHDPSFPKPRGLLPVPPEIEEAVAREEARITREHGVVIAPEARQRM